MIARISDGTDQAMKVSSSAPVDDYGGGSGTDDREERQGPASTRTEGPKSRHRRDEVEDSVQAGGEEEDRDDAAKEACAAGCSDLVGPCAGECVRQHARAPSERVRYRVGQRIVEREHGREQAGKANCP